MKINRNFIAVILSFVFSNIVFASDIVVTIRNDKCSAVVGDHEYRCSFGKNGITADKREGDGKTPIGKFSLREILIRPDKVVKNNLKYVSLPIQIIKENDGWCDEPKDRNYNTQVDLDNFDHSISHEKLYRDDGLYNIVIVVGYNDAPVVPGKGSAIFIHVSRPEYTGTAGCIGFSESDLLKILAKLDDKSKLIVQNFFSS